MAQVNSPSKEHQRMSHFWVLPRTLMGGTRAMRKASILFLPQEPAESAESYQARLHRSTLFNAFKKTIKDTTGKVFTKPIVLEKDVPADITKYSENIDLCGRHLNVFARDVFYDSLQLGIGFIFTEMPPPIEQGSGADGVVTKADEIASGRRPYLIYIKGEDVIGWQSESVDGVIVLTQVRIRETACIPDGPWGEKEIQQIRVLRIGSWEIWREVEDGPKKGNWVLFSSGVTSLDKIPLAPVYINRCGFMTGEPPLEDLAELNVSHWQSQSDQRNILHVARVPILFGAGFSADDAIVIGAGSMARSSDANAKLVWVEHTGAAINSGDKDLQNLETQMAAMGAKLVKPAPGGKTATGEVADDMQENSPLAMMATALQDAIEQSFGFMAEYMGLGADKGGSVKVNKDFGVAKSGTTDLQQFATIRANGDISQETLWSEMQRRDFLSDSFDPQVEKELLDAEKEKNMLDAQTAMDLAEPPEPVAPDKPAAKPAVPAKPAAAAA